MYDIKKHRKKPAVHVSDATVRASLHARGFYNAWITPELIKAERLVIAARLQHPPKRVRHLIPGDYG
jgi:hypothetical protein